MKKWGVELRVPLPVDLRDTIEKEIQSQVQEAKIRRIQWPAGPKSLLAGRSGLVISLKLDDIQPKPKNVSESRIGLERFYRRVHNLLLGYGVTDYVGDLFVGEYSSRSTSSEDFLHELQQHWFDT